MLSDKEVGNIKQQLISHIESTFSPEQAGSAKKQIESMDSEQLEQFLEKNNMIAKGNSEDASEENSPENCVFCSIVSGKIKSVKLDENKNAIAVLEINPISKGHAIIIPRVHEQKVSERTMSLANKISKKIKKKFKPKSVEIMESKLFGHGIVNILPVYDKENFNSDRKKAKIEDLELVREELERKAPKREKKKVKVEKIQEFFWLPKRIP